ncbi:Flp pilus assembly protein CpaB [Lutimaribacter sp. EGI FJ00015]|uniref:Flp pilus assembly protein CpaB n=1 Tax=Lutimaribacter degradans TaxID=2945989 RepID=A0ACC5ZS55_9RHOB|nr:Flp pilus assembly protein CpaB [Lutimaribacter sp. EGI FJ00013]MCM2560616.1 Flp pilus assembly protein CpaB [Lutimaribacter sp. EGI FJ00013]MCO0612441.1 Flp pilus assembly protein CpaB [Lutimaribacter sp. EGI FJ00015]MCO0634440.1 Flp pilus assembly protein CpaB [Lutimaribacter sp. EGI FJ00014]
MRVIFGLVLVAGLALAGFAVYMAKNYIASYQARLAEANAMKEQLVKTVPVYVAERPLKYGEILMPEDVREVRWPEEAVPEGAFTQEGALFPENTDERRRVLRTMEKDEAVMAVKVTQPGEEVGITSQLERGKRAFAIKVDVASGVSGFLMPGHRVDVYWTGQVARSGGARNSESRQEVTKLIETGVNVIAIDQSANSETTGAAIARTVTVSVRPEQVASLALAQSTGRLSLALVGLDDDSVSGAIEIDQRKLLGLADMVVEEEVKEKVCTIRTRRGSEVVEIPIPCTN